MKKICIDPGHGGYDPGACAGGVREKDITLHIGLQLRDLFQRAGFPVIMTRDTDQSPGGFTEVNADLRERCRISNAAGADIFLSIHVNAGGGRGAEIYVNGDGGPIAGLTSGIVTNFASICGSHGRPVRDGGPNGAGWAVICNTLADAMLLEVGFIDSDDLLKIQAHIDEFAPLIARSFCNFYGVPYPTLNETKIDKAVVNVLLPVFGQLYVIAAPDAQVAYNYAANALRLSAGIPIDTDLGRPTRAAAEHVIAVLSALWKPAKAEARDALHYAADALRSAVGIEQ